MRCPSYDFQSLGLDARAPLGWRFCGGDRLRGDHGSAPVVVGLLPFGESRIPIGIGAAMGECIRTEFVGFRWIALRSFRLPIGMQRTFCSAGSFFLNFLITYF